ncbi:sugar transferase [Rhodococcus sp. ARC_M6]|uniref:sugar transferase n=1 Tax=Rhodococcus sp. ARC_M6 TaxID=2928852 RepID=UPI001FB21B02|nr:sugar transferase [Rhodococcus sp. ARC_M6]MCJ0902128.1 sugar transferase [Rhodococcus sp. ARC_M6]
MTALDVSTLHNSEHRRPRAVPDPTHDSAPRNQWEAVYRRRLVCGDVVIVLAAVFLAQWFRFGGDVTAMTSGALGHLNYTGVSMTLAGMWLASLGIFRTRSIRVIGSGPEEYRRIFIATVRLFGLIAIVSLLFQLDIARLYLAFAFPLGLSALMISRLVSRKLIARKRARGEFQTSVLVVGSRSAVLNLAENFERGTADGFRVVGVCVPGHIGAKDKVITVGGREIPILGDEHDVIGALDLVRADTVAVTATERLGCDGMRKLAWDLETKDVDLVVAPSILDVAGPRLSMRPVAGLPLIHVERPRYHGAQRIAKTSFDFLFASLILLAISPVLLATAIAVKVTSSGPIFYKSERMGLDGQPFSMLKFRSMVQDADKRVDALMKNNEGAGVLFKMREDPRVTKVGKIIRRYSIDELPQFVNVLRREMSVVGPRPPLRREVEAYDGTVKRRLLVKPGITGLWQVSGRSDLSWEETVRLDLSYVDNWSMMGDVLIVAKTLKAVVGSDGAY